MKLSVNRNTVWCDVFVQHLVDLGVLYACISPGSRSTPLTLAFASNNSIKTFPIVDERSSAFFALGLAKKSNTPVVIVTTSGTAVAELYPAIIEAYYQRVPLIVCTADRPHLLRNRGANQTINQQNIYKNHIRFFADAGLPDLDSINKLKKITFSAVKTASNENRGPVHINFPFEKPFEPEDYTEKIDSSSLKKYFSKNEFKTVQNIFPAATATRFANKFSKIERGLILTSYNNYSPDFAQQLAGFSEKFGYPIFVDGSSSLRFGSHPKENLIENLTAIVRAKDFQKYFDPELIIQFGSAPTSNVMLEFFKKSKAEKILVNRFGDWYDPSLTATSVVKAEPSQFCSAVALSIKTKKESKWLQNLQAMNKIAAQLKNKFITKAKFPFEGRISNELLNILPRKSNLMISNSLPIRDFDFFASPSNKQIKIFTNRGASGIDGINSTALGIAKASNEQTFLLIGDLAFYHDTNGLHNSIKHKIPLTIVLINNRGGGIFESLPISGYREFFTENFATPLEIDFKKMVEAYSGNFIKIKSWKEFREKVILSSKNKKLTVLEVQTDAKRSKAMRHDYWNAVSNRIVEFINETKS